MVTIGILLIIVGVGEYFLFKISAVRDFIIKIIDSPNPEMIALVPWVTGILGIVLFFWGLNRNYAKSPEGKAEMERIKQVRAEKEEQLKIDAPMGYGAPGDKAICPDCKNVLGTGVKYAHPCPRCGYAGRPKFRVWNL